MAARLTRCVMSAIRSQSPVMMVLLSPRLMMALRPSLKTRRSGRSDEILIWGNILPYKGVLEFISSPAVRVAGLNVRIVGRCKDPGMAKDIEKAVAECDSAEFVGSYSNGSESLRSKIIFENRAATLMNLHLWSVPASLCCFRICQAVCQVRVC